MTIANTDTRFFQTTRGQIILLLRDSAKTVNELATELNITNNAVRAHLLVLERDGHVRQGGTTKGFRRPHYVYNLTDKARQLFPRPFDSLFNKLLAVLKRTLSPSSFGSTLNEVGKDIAAEDPPDEDASDADKINKAISTLQAMGGLPKVVEKNGRTIIESDACPFAEAVTEHPETCKIAESAVAKIVSKSVDEQCDRDGEPKCRFVIGD